MHYIYMNHNIREKKITDPVIVVQRPDGAKVYTNSVSITHNGEVVAEVVFDEAGVPKSTHDVKAFVRVKDGAQVKVL